MGTQIKNESEICPNMIQSLQIQILTTEALSPAWNTSKGKLDLS